MKLSYIKFTVLAIMLVCLFQYKTTSVSAEDTVFKSYCLMPNPSKNDRWHTFTLHGTVPKNENVYVYACLDGENGTNCTAGIDKSGKDIDAVLRNMGYKINSPNLDFQVFTDEPIVTANGEISVNIHINGKKGTQRLDLTGSTGRFFALSQEKVATPAPTTIEDATSQKQTNLDLDSLERPDCVSTKWDPFGRIFDSRSLEPLPGVTVELLDSNKKHYSEVGIENPQVTALDGFFSYYVSNGTYYLTPSRVDYHFPILKTELNPQYTLAYSDLYLNQDPIIENNKTVHVDIPMATQGSPYQSDVSLISYSEFILPDSNTLIIEGRVSHPLASVSVTQNSRTLLNVKADKFGFFKAAINNTTVEPSNQLTMKFIKTDLITNKQIPNIQKTATVEPILRYLEGYAYDEKGYVIPNATVNVILTMSNETYYQTRADSTGYFRIANKYLPTYNYSLEFINPANNQNTKITTSIFVQRNNTFLSTNKLNLNDTQTDKNNSPRTYLNDQKSNPNAVKDNSSSSSSVLVQVLIIILMVILVAGTIVYFVKRKKSIRHTKDSMHI